MTDNSLLNRGEIIACIFPVCWCNFVFK